jgi:hypothetical protein
VKLRLLRWLGAVSIAEFDVLRAADRQQIRDEYRSALMDIKAEYEAAITEVIQELNTVRNSIPTALTAEPRPPVQVFRSFRDFKRVVESRKPIRVERTQTQ